MQSSRLTPFFQPYSIAIIGASETGMYPAGILRNLLNHGYTGNLYPINPRRTQLFGLPCYPNLTELPETPDLAIIIVPRQVMVSVVEQCVQLGVPAVLIITAGFGESDDEGKALAAALSQLVKTGRTAIIGPNCAGLANIPDRVIATNLSTPPRAGNVSFVSASGALMMALYGVFADHQLGLSRLLSLGNQMDVNLGEALAYLAADPHTQVIGAFVEGIDDGAGFVAAAQAALAAAKPIVLVKSGRTVAGKEAAATHTAVLAGSDRVFQAVCRQFGVVQVNDVAELARTVQMFSAWAGRWPSGRRIALVTQSGGMGSLTADLCTLARLELPPLSATVRTQLQSMAHALAFDQFGNPADVRGAGVAGAVTAQTLAPFLADPETDVVILLLAKSTVREDALPTAEAIVAAAQSSPKPLCVVWAGQQVLEDVNEWSPAFRLLMKAGVPIFTQPSDCVNALAKVIAYQKRGARGEEHGATTQHATRTMHYVSRITHHASCLFSYRATAELLHRYDIALVRSELVSDLEDAVAAAKRIGYPVAVKLMAPHYAHKSDAGLVQLHVEGDLALRSAVADMFAAVSGAEVEGILVQAMAGAGVEVIAGISYDPQFGPVLACGAGGVLVELLDEVALRLPPLSIEEAHTMITETRLARLLAGWRGQPAADVGALAELLVKLSSLAVDTAGKLVSLDLNPVIVLPQGQGVAVVDVRATWR